MPCGLSVAKLYLTPAALANRGASEFSPVLESRALLIGPWSRVGGNKDWVHAVAPGSWIRPIRDAATLAPLGFAAWRNAGRGLWASWFGKRQITLFETDDASLLLTLRRGFWRLWDVYDAEERRIGTIYRNAVLGRGGEQVALVRQPRSDKPGSFFLSAHQDLARYWQRGDEWQVEFGDASLNPFQRMALLAAVLSWGTAPASA